MEEFPRFGQSEFICNVSFKVDPRTKRVLDQMRLERINIGQWIREMVTRELERVGRLSSQTGPVVIVPETVDA